ncbi:MAG: hypothetical protein JO033_01955 [Acidobacteriaceae bacterium]|nr:hypothetical protein [Acidobacteriaceae bacterium]MBV9500615.1 hypothetical protein [Acidobacteriaceae bacterium]
MRVPIVVLAVAASVILGGCGRKTTRGISLDRVSRPLIPPDTKVLAGADVTKLEASELYRRENGRFPVPIFDEMSRQIGVDPRRDITETIVAWDGKHYLLLLRGKFSPAELERKLSQAGLHSTHYGKYRLLGDSSDSVAFLTTDLAVAGPVEMLKPAIDRFGSGNTSIPDELQERLKLVPSGDQIWLASRGGLPFAEAAMPSSDIGSLLSNIVGYVSATSLGIAVDSGLHVRGQILCVSNEGAKRVHDALRGAIGFGRLSTKSNEMDLLKIYDAIHVEQAEQTVNVSADLPGSLADELLNRFSTPGQRSTR